MSRPEYVSDVHRALAPGIAEAMRNPEHLRVGFFECVDYGGPQDVDTQVFPPQRQPAARFSLRRFLRRQRCRA